MNCEDFIKAYLMKLESGFHCKSQKNFIRITSPYLYPDNDAIEIFIKEKDGRYTITDLGETLRHLYSQGFDAFSSPKRRFLIDRILKNSKAEFEKGKIFRTS